MENRNYWPFAPAQRFKITSGKGVAEHGINAFDFALMNAGISDYNLVKISSILPPRSTESHQLPPKGSALQTAYVQVTSNQFGAVLAAGVAVGIPKDKTKIGVIMEDHYGYQERVVQHYRSGQEEKDYIETTRIYLENKAKISREEMLLRLKHDVEIAMLARNLKIAEIKTSVVTDYIMDAGQFHAVIAAVSIW